MTYDVSKLPAVRAQLERDLVARAAPAAAASAQAPVEYARAPQAPGGPIGAGRPPATQETNR